MKVLHLTTYENLGGAAKAAQRLHQGLINTGVDSRIFSQFSDGFESMNRIELFSAKARRKLDQLPVKFYGARLPLPFSPAIVPRSLNSLEGSWQPDIVHAHWINHGFASIESIGRIHMPMIWTFHDSWPFTGGCHIPMSCTKYRDACGACPELNSTKQNDLSSRVLDRKKRSWQQLNFSPVCPSQWLATAAKSSSLLGQKSIAVIPNAIDLDVFSPEKGDPDFRTQHQIAPDKKIILVGAMENTRDVNKGFHHFVEALKILRTTPGSEKIHVVIFGGDEMGSGTIEGFSTTHLGTLRSEPHLATAYAEARVFVCPSLLENLPYTVIESLACGTPVVGFRTGGIPELIDHESNGYLAEAFSPASLSRGIEWILTHTQHDTLRANSRRFAESHLSQGAVTRQYVDLYNQALKKP